MAVHRLKGGEQAGPALAVQATDRAAQAADGETQFLALGLGRGRLLLELGKLPLGDEIDRSDPLALRRDRRSTPGSSGTSASTATAIRRRMFACATRSG